MNKSSFKFKLFIYFFIAFILFTVIVAFFEYQQEINHKENKLISVLDNNNHIINNYIQNNNVLEHKNYDSLFFLSKLFPDKELRITLIDKKGTVLYDNFYNSYFLMGNHLDRPEVKESFYSGSGHEIRYSNTLKQKYYYFSRYYKNYYIRVALPYDKYTINLLKPDSVYLYFLITIFIISSILLIIIANKISKTIDLLKNFSIKAANNEFINQEISFPSNELGIIAKQIISIYNNLKKTKDNLSQEQKKLIKHIQITRDGVAIFDNEKQNVFANSFFIQYASLLNNNSLAKPEEIFDLENLKPLNDYIDKKLINKPFSYDKDIISNTFNISKDDHHFSVNAIIFQDHMFEIYICDNSQTIKEQKLKYEMTSNISHELKTPVSSIKGYLETLLDKKDLDETKRDYFIQRAFIQTERLTELINDISILNKIEEASSSLNIETVNINDIIKDVVEDIAIQITEKDITIDNQISKPIEIKGNSSLIYSIFKNLTDNSLKYAGENAKIKIKNYYEDKDFYYFSFSDNGPGVPEEHLSRIFERFYRIDKGRSRNSGGTGLGLSIVKNAVKFHNGEISAKISNEGGLEFLFNLKR